MTRVLIVFSILVLIFSSCYDSDIEGENLSNNQPELRTFSNVDEALWPYFVNFEKEAAARNLNVNLNLANITGSIEPIHEEGVAGSCSYGRFRNNEIIIDSEFWSRAPNLYREYIVFHELGHCYLSRDHLDACLSNRTWQSLMRSGTESTCRDNYTNFTREYYIDELFGVDD